jgi:BASS family bile acid:Na+ symporter
MKPGFGRTAAILIAMVTGALLPQAHALAWTIRWLVMAMLFIVFLGTRPARAAFRRSHGVLLLANLGIGFAGWGLGWLVGGRDVALAAFFAGIAPTAIAAPPIVSFLRGRVDYIIAAFFLTNLGIAALLPFLLPLVLGHATPDTFMNVLRSVGLVIFVPLAVATLVRVLHPPAATWPERRRDLSFAMWVIAIFLVTANASDFVRRQTAAPHVVLAQIAVVTLAVCAAGFALGRVIGGREFGREASQALGQKHTTFAIYLALTYASPLVALGPTCYVVWHNLWNSWQLHRAAAHHTSQDR